MYARMDSYICIYVYTLIDKFVYIYIYIYTHINKCMNSKSCLSSGIAYMLFVVASFCEYMHLRHLLWYFLLKAWTHDACRLLSRLVISTCMQAVVSTCNKRMYAGCCLDL